MSARTQHIAAWVLVLLAVGWFLRREFAAPERPRRAAAPAIPAQVPLVPADAARRPEGAVTHTASEPTPAPVAREPTVEALYAAHRLPVSVEGWLSDAREVGHPCTHDADCGRWERCRLGLCMNHGAPCDTDEVCGAEARCDEGYCTSGARQCGGGKGGCKDGSPCVVGACWQEEPRCVRDADCGAGRRCFIGICIQGERDCVADSDCPSGERCELDECTGGARECVTDDDCGEAARCVFGSCAEGARDCDLDSACRADQRCELGHCTNGARVP